MKEIQDTINKIMLKRNEIKEQFLETWIATNIPDKNLTIDYLINNIVLCESFSSDTMTYTWYVKFKDQN